MKFKINYKIKRKKLFLPDEYNKVWCIIPCIKSLHSSWYLELGPIPENEYSEYVKNSIIKSYLLGINTIRNEINNLSKEINHQLIERKSS